MLTLRAVCVWLILAAAHADPAALAAPPAGDSSGAENVTTFEDVLSIWRERAAGARTLYAEVHVEQFVPRGSQLPPDLMQSETPYPETDTSLELDVRVWIEGQRWRNDRIGLEWYQPAGRFEEAHWVELLDDDRRIGFFGKANPTNDAYPKAYVSLPGGRDGREPEGSSGEMWTWMINFRNEHPLFPELRSSDWRISQQRSVIDGRECLFAERSMPADSPVFRRCWIDPARGHCMVRWESGAGGVVTVKSEIQYREDPLHGWVPAEWMVIDQAQGQGDAPVFQGSRSYTVERLSINEEFEDVPFEFEIPAGTWVDDNTRGNDTAMYMIRHDGAERPITVQELMRGSTYRELLTTPTGEAGRPVRREHSSWWIWGGLSVLALAVGAYLLRRAV